MSFFTSYKNYILLAIGVVIVGLVAFERMGIRLGRPPDTPAASPFIIPGGGVSVAPSPSPSPSPSVSGGPGTPGAGRNPLPMYQGRDPEEVRPVAEEVKLFSEDQKQEIYRAIGNHGKAVKENSDYFNGWIQVGLLKKVIGDFEGARDAWEYAGIIRPKNSISFANLGELYWRYLRDYAKSESNFRISIVNKSDDPATYASLSDLYFYSYAEKAHLTDDILLQGLSVNPGSLDLMTHLARRYEEVAEYQKAIEWWEKALAKDPGNSQIAAAIESLRKKVQ